ncbi:MAG: hypothetical protein QM696_03105 [Steroidobacteraceae bacterium]
MLLAAQEIRKDGRVGGGDAPALQAAKALPRLALGHRDRQPAMAEIQLPQHLEAGGGAALGHLQPPLLEHIETHQPEIADILLHQVGNIVVAHEQHIQRQVLAKAHELVLAARELQAAASQQIQRVFREPARLLHGKLEAGVFVHGLHPLRLPSRRRTATE